MPPSVCDIFVESFFIVVVLQFELDLFYSFPEIPETVYELRYFLHFSFHRTLVYCWNFVECLMEV